MTLTYAINKNATPAFGLTTLGGHSLVGHISVGRMINTHSDVSLSYDRIQNRYDGIASVASNPSSDRIMVSYNWRFERPVGR